MLALRPYLPLRMVLTVCGRCFSEDPDRDIDYETDILQGNLVAMDVGVYLRRTCRRGHGVVTSLYEEDHARWEYLQQWRTPTREIIPDTRIVYSEVFEGASDAEALTTVTFTEAAGRTTLTILVQYDSAQDRDAHSNYMNDGLQEALGLLEQAAISLPTRPSHPVRDR